MPIKTYRVFQGSSPNYSYKEMNIYQKMRGRLFNDYNKAKSLPQRISQ